MLRWLWRLLFGSCCDHHWVVMKEIETYDVELGMDMPRWRRYVMQCDKCGWIRSKRV